MYFKNTFRKDELILVKNCWFIEIIVRCGCVNNNYYDTNVYDMVTRCKCYFV